MTHRSEMHVGGKYSTSPSPTLYPHQWSWNSALIAIGYHHYDTEPAIDGIEVLFRRQRSNGHIPHTISSLVSVERRFRGPLFKMIKLAGESGAEIASTSGHTNPPVHAVLLPAVHKNGHSNMKEIALKKLQKMYSKLARLRD